MVAGCVHVVDGQDALDMERHLGPEATASAFGAVFAGIELVAVAVHDTEVASYVGPCLPRYREVACHLLLHRRRHRHHQSHWDLYVRWGRHA